MSSISGMITSLKNNKRSRVSTFEKIKNFKEGNNIQVTFDKKATESQLRRIREKLEEENKQKMKRNLILFGIGMGILIYFIGFVKF